NEDLKRQKDALERELKNLVGRIEAVKKWEGTDFVLLNPTHYTVGVKREGDSFRLTQSAEWASAEDVRGACRNWHIPRIPDDPAYTRNLASSVKPGEVIPDQYVKFIKDEIWGHHQYAPFAPEMPEQELQLVTFRELKSYDMKLGLYVDADAEGLSYFTLQEDPVRVAWNEIQPGSARRGDVQDVLRNMTSVDFLEYCLLRVAQKLGTVEDELSHIRPRLLVKVDLEIPDDHLRFYEKIDQQLEAQGRTPEVEYASGTLGVLAYFFNSVNRASIPGRRLQLRREMLATDPHRRVRHLSRYVEDEVLARLSQLNIQSITEKDRELLASISSDELDQSLELASSNDATHLLRVIVKDSKNSGDYHLSVRLYREDGKGIWTDEGDRVMTTPGVASQYHTASGHLGLVYLKKDTFEEFTGTENPVLIEELKHRSAKERYSHLVYVESSPEAVRDHLLNDLEHRTLFSHKVHTSPVNNIESVQFIESIDDVPTEFMLRYLSCQIVEELLPHAGTVVETNGKSATVRLGKNLNVNPGDLLRVMRMVSQPDSLSGADFKNDRSAGLMSSGEYLLPTGLVVSKVDSREATVAVSPTNFEDVWPDNVALKKDDLVITKISDTPIVSIEQFRINPIGPNVKRWFRTKNSLHMKEYETRTINTGKDLMNRIQSSLASLNIPIISSKNNSSQRSSENKNEATHRIHGSIGISESTNVTSGKLLPIYSIEVIITSNKTNEVLKQFHFEIDDIFNPSR
ncbi:MAG: hypothetical protein KDA78_17560, partial [Planctomycetaceae bacterium]|nr:hypothetical protein [Planctomycetaceae bacterium]